jgi:hypothetical protein
MKTATKRIVALTGGALMIATTVAASPASARDGERRYRDRSEVTECTVDLNQNRRTLEVDVRSDGNAQDNALVVVDFDTRRDRGDERQRVALSGHGNAELDFSIPRRAETVDVTTYIGGRRDGISCTNTLTIEGHFNFGA